MPNAIIETRMDGAFFSEKLIALLDELGVEYTISVPFERYTTIKGHVQERKRWRRVCDDIQFFEKQLSLQSWDIPRHRFLFVREHCKLQRKEPIQLDLFEPYDFDYQYKSIITNKTTIAVHIIEYHQGRGTQEGLFAQLKSQPWHKSQCRTAHALPSKGAQYNSPTTSALGFQANGDYTKTNYTTGWQTD